MFEYICGIVLRSQYDDYSSILLGGKNNPNFHNLALRYLFDRWLLLNRLSTYFLKT